MCALPKPTLSKSEQNRIITCAHKLADCAGRTIMPFFRGDVSVDNKASNGFDPVTAADRAAEHAMRTALANMCPMDAVIGEEFGTHNKQNHRITWVLDPIDGTRSFIVGAPTWVTLIAACYDRTPVFGVIDQPYIGERWAGGFGSAEFTHTAPARAAQRTLLELNQRHSVIAKAVLMTTYPMVKDKAEQAALARVIDSVNMVRYSMDGYGFALLAMGLVDIVIECGVKGHDCLAPAAVIRAAGGRITDWFGDEGTLFAGGNVVASVNADLHAHVIKLLNSSNERVLR